MNICKKQGFNSVLHDKIWTSWQLNKFNKDISIALPKKISVILICFGKRQRKSSNNMHTSFKWSRNKYIIFVQHSNLQPTCKLNLILQLVKFRHDLMILVKQHAFTRFHPFVLSIRKKNWSKKPNQHFAFFKEFVPFFGQIC